MYAYPAVFEPDEKAGGYVVTFPDFGYGVTQGETIEEAVDMAADLLQALIADRIEKKEDLPPASKPGKGMRTIPLSALADLKTSLYVAMREEGVRKAELARRLGTQKSQVDRLLDFENSTRLEQLEAAFRVLKKRVRIKVENAA